MLTAGIYSTACYDYPMVWWEMKSIIDDTLLRDFDEDYIRKMCFTEVSCHENKYEYTLNIEHLKAVFRKQVLKKEELYESAKQAYKERVSKYMAIYNQLSQLDQLFVAV